MIKLKQLIDESYPSYEEISWWMNPDGKLYRVPLEGHYTFAVNYLEIYQQKNPNDTRINQDDVYKSMYNLGWIRVVAIRDMGVYSIQFNLIKEKTPTSIQKDALVELAKEYNATDILNASIGRIYLSADNDWQLE